MAASAACLAKANELSQVDQLLLSEARGEVHAGENHAGENMSSYRVA